MEQIEPEFEGDFVLEDRAFRLDSGEELHDLRIRFAIYGSLADNRDSVVLACHALSGSARVGDWWPQMFGRGLPFDLERTAVVCANAIGSCYGTTGPRSLDPATGERYGSRFPVVTMRDVARAHTLVLDHLGVERVRLAIGGSIGGMQALQLAIDEPDRVASCIAIGAAPLEAMGLALNHLQRAAIELDPGWSDGAYVDGGGPARGLALARAIGMCTYKSADLFTERHARRPDRGGGDPYSERGGRFDVAGYLDRQGRVFLERFDAASYIALSRVMDSFEPARGYASEHEAIARIRARTLLVGISSDWLFPAASVRAFAEALERAGVDARYVELASSHGHDGFLVEVDELANICGAFLEGSSDGASGA